MRTLSLLIALAAIKIVEEELAADINSLRQRKDQLEEKWGLLPLLNSTGKPFDEHQSLCKQIISLSDLRDRLLARVAKECPRNACEIRGK